MDYYDMKLDIPKEMIVEKLKQEGLEVNEENIERVLKELQTNLECSVSGAIEEIVEYHLD